MPSSVRAKTITTLRETVRRCAYCGREHVSSPLECRENPFCGACLSERLEKARAEVGTVEWRRTGDYVEFLTANSRTPP